MKKYFYLSAFLFIFLFGNKIAFANSLYDQINSESSHIYISDTNNGTVNSWPVSGIPDDFVATSITIKASAVYDSCTADDWQLVANNNNTFDPIDFSIETNPSYTNTPSLSSQNGLVSWTGLHLTGKQLNNTWFLAVNAKDVNGFGCINNHGHGNASITVGDTLAANSFIGKFNLFSGEPYPDYTPYIILNGVIGKTPVLIIPGVLGTDINQGNNLLWANPKMARGFDGFMDPLAFNSDLVPIDTSLTTGSVIRSKGIPGFTSHYTDSLINQLTSSNIGYTEGKDLFTFPYDWRFGVSEDAVNQLKGEIAFIASSTGSSVVNVVAHSTGGLLVKKYVMENPTDHHIGKAVFVGVPNLGSPKALKLLLNGDSFDVAGLDPQEMKKIGQNMPVVYDLAPSASYYGPTGMAMQLHNPLAAPGQVDQGLNYAGTIQNLVTQNFINQKAVTNSQGIHTPAFENLDLRNYGVDLYSIVGCKSGTFSGMTETTNKLSIPTFDHPTLTDGDQTVPFLSADSLFLDPAKIFFAPNIKHGDLLSANGSRQQIVNLLTGSNLSTNGKILNHDTIAQNPSLCEIKGESINIKSPVAVGVTDQDGNFSGVAGDGSIQNDIPGADYEVWGEHKYVFLPTDGGQVYSIKLAGTGVGTFTVDDQSINGNTVTQTQIFSNLPVTPALAGVVNLGNGGPTTLSLQVTPTSSPVTIFPDSTINAAQSLDLTPPISTSTITGTLGQPGFYRSNVSIALSATDPVANNDPSQTSGVLKISYSLDGAPTTTYQSAINVTTEGAHNISFFSTDNAGNNEAPQIVTLIIDKTAPETAVQFSPSLKDIQFTGSDNISTTSKVTVLDNVNDILLTDEAGNSTDIKLKEKNRKVSMASTIQSLSYNGAVQDISKNILAFAWSYDKNNNLTLLSQNVAAKKAYYILAVYNGKNTTLAGIDKTGIILKSVTGLDILRVSTSKGDLLWTN